MFLADYIFLAMRYSCNTRYNNSIFIVLKNLSLILFRILNYFLIYVILLSVSACDRRKYYLAERLHQRYSCFFIPDQGIRIIMRGKMMMNINECQEARNGKPLPYLVHMTDLFHPHGDPDDHFDLALAFALHSLGYLELGRVICDYPPAHRAGDPALCAVAQLNEITGSDVRVSAAPSDPDAQARMVANILRESDRPVCFTVVGTTEHIGGAIRSDPDLFAKKCAGIWLAAGTGAENADGELEYNVRLHPASFVTVLNAPCPVIWAPCFHTILPGESGEKGGEYGSVYCIRQKELLDTLSPEIQNYFLYMLTRSQDPKYLRYLKSPADERALSDFGERLRRLWSTPLLLNAAGISCDSFEFLPVKIKCAADARVSWEPDAGSDRSIFHIKRCDRETDDSFDCTGTYRDEMLSQMKRLIGSMSRK